MVYRHDIILAAKAFDLTACSNYCNRFYFKFAGPISIAAFANRGGPGVQRTAADDSAMARGQSVIEERPYEKRASTYTQACLPEASIAEIRL